jgi:SAM-dependent methyltransferase
MGIVAGLRRTLRNVLNRMLWSPYEKRMEGTLQPDSPSYRQYLRTQLRRTLSKRHVPLRPHTVLLVDQVAEFVPLQACDVLCIGCRNTAEIDYFTSKGARKVTGIDLYSTHPRILVMDMHKLQFPDDAFDIVYSAHSLEHAYDPRQVAGEMVRVVRPGGIIVIEVPTDFQSGEADLVDFGRLESLRELFGPSVGEVLMEEALEASTPRNWCGTPILRTMFRVTKSP